MVTCNVAVGNHVVIQWASVSIHQPLYNTFTTESVTIFAMHRIFENFLTKNIKKVETTSKISKFKPAFFRLHNHSFKLN
jgi:hypothetical protein